MEGFIATEHSFDSSLHKYYEGRFTQGNGYLSVRASFEEGLADAPQNEEYMRTMKSVTTEIQRHPLSKWGVYIPLIMGENPFLGEVIVNLPYIAAVRTEIDGKPLDMIYNRIRGYSRSLNMENGVLTRTFLVQTDGGAEVRFCFERFASMEEKHTFLQKVTCEVVKGEADIRFQPGINGDVTTNGYRHCQRSKISFGEKKIVYHCTTDMGFGIQILTEVSGEQAGEWSESRTDWEGYLVTERHLKEGEHVSFVKRTVVTTSRDQESTDYRLHGEQILERIRKPYGQLRAENDRVWNRKWKESDLMISGNRELQEGLRFSIYHMLRSNMEEESRVQICAKGFAGEAYYGRFFWDTEIYLLPFYIYTNPKAARNLLPYRYHTLEGARKNARRYHCRGARYPWHSGIEGTEQCSLWEYADNEVHVTADIAYALMHYYRATDDYEFIRDYGLEILLETSRFWMCRVSRGEHGQIDLLNVMGPDEYSPMTRNNAFTNRMVQENLRAAVEMASLVKEKSPDAYEKLTKRLKLAKEELKEFEETAGRLRIPYDNTRALVLQSEDFETYEKIDLDSLWKDKKKAFGHFVSQEKLYRSRCLKQADVIALMNLFPREFTEKQVRAAYDYYMPLTTHDSSLSPACHAFAAHRIGRKEDVRRFLQLALDVDLNQEKKGAEDGIHIANCGYLWQLVVQGFAGVKTAMESEEFCISPRLPEGIGRIAGTLYWKGEQRKIDVRRYQAVLFDLDGVICHTDQYHYLAWKTLADRLGIPFSEQENQRLRGVSRRESLEILLEKSDCCYSEEEKQSFAEEKNHLYREKLDEMTPSDLDLEVKRTLELFKSMGYRMAVASSSKNAGFILEKIGLSGFFDTVVDGNQIIHSKPDPEVFLQAASQVGLKAEECLVVEDASAGILAAREGGFDCVLLGSAEGVKADYHLERFADLKHILGSDSRNIDFAKTDK